MRQGLWRLWLIGVTVAAVTVVLGGTGTAGAARGKRVLHGAAAREVARNALARAHTRTRRAGDGSDAGLLADQFAQYNNERTAPAAAVSGPGGPGAVSR